MTMAGSTISPQTAIVRSRALMVMDFIPRRKVKNYINIKRNLHIYIYIFAALLLINNYERVYLYHLFPATNFSVLPQNNK